MSDLIDRQAAIDALAKFVPYAICDESTESYTNGLTDAYNLILQLPSAQPDVPDTNVGDMISRQAAIDAVRHAWAKGLEPTQFLEELPSAQPDRDIPKKPTATTDKSWGIPHRQAVCPNCDCFLGTVYFICDGDSNGKRKVTYCESCGQAIDWEGWEFETD